MSEDFRSYEKFVDVIFALVLFPLVLTVLGVVDDFTLVTSLGVGILLYHPLLLLLFMVTTLFKLYGIWTLSFSHACSRNPFGYCLWFAVVIYLVLEILNV